MARNRRGAATTLAERPAAESKPAAPEVVYPAENEVIEPADYSFQIKTSGETAGVEICIDQGEWRACRPALGLWWYDWSGYDEGEHEAVVLLRRPDATTVRSEPRLFYVRSKKGPGA